MQKPVINETKHLAQLKQPVWTVLSPIFTDGSSPTSLEHLQQDMTFKMKFSQT